MATMVCSYNTAYLRRKTKEQNVVDGMMDVGCERGRECMRWRLIQGFAWVDPAEPTLV